jgi:biotin carboxyl carrier protein
MRHRYQVQTAPQKGQAPLDALVEVEPLGEGRYRMRLPGEEEMILEAHPRPAQAATSWSVRPEGGGRQRVFDIEGALPDLKVSDGKGEPLALKLLDERAALAQRQAGPEAIRAASGPAALRAPMPGKVVKVLCQQGAQVKAGQGLVIIEAMKMENELRAPRDGVVQELRATEGQSVDGSVVLVTLA